MLRFAFRLSLATGKDVEEIAEWDCNKIQMWMAFYEAEPFGNEWLQSAQIVAAMANLWGRKKGQQAFKIDKFMPVQKQQSFDELKNAILGMVAETNKKYQKEIDAGRKPKRTQRRSKNSVVGNQPESQVDSSRTKSHVGNTRNTARRRGRRPTGIPLTQDECL